jgi:hypothetical protein
MACDGLVEMMRVGGQAMKMPSKFGVPLAGLALALAASGALALDSVVAIKRATGLREAPG